MGKFILQSSLNLGLQENFQCNLVTVDAVFSFGVFP